MKHEESKSSVTPTELSTTEILATYQSLGLATAADRSRFTAFQDRQQRVQFDVVISDNSQPAFLPA